MISITKLTLENFQSHKYTVINFDKGLNSIVGPTDSGKTAIFRALKWAIYNEPAGDYFLRNGEDYVSVKVEFSNGQSVRRFKKKAKNGYEITDVNGEITEFYGFGRTVPDEVIAASGVSKINLTPNEGRYINMAEQLDQPFLLSETPSLKAAAIGKLVGSDVIDAALRNTATDLTRKKQEKAEVDKQIAEIDEELKNFEYLVDLETTLENVESIIKSIKEKENLLTLYLDLKNRLDKVKDNIYIHENELSELKFTKNVEDLYLKLVNHNSYFKEFLKLKKGLEQVNNSMETSKRLLGELKHIDTLNSSYNELEKKISKKKTLENLLFRINSNTKAKNVEEKIKSELSNFDKVVDINNKLNKLVSLNDNLKGISEKYTEYKERIVAGNNYMQQFAQFENIINIEDNLNGLMSKYKVLKPMYEKLIIIKSDKTKIEKDLERTYKVEESTKLEYKNILEKMDVCPTCLRPMSKHDSEEIFKHIHEV